MRHFIRFHALPYFFDWLLASLIFAVFKQLLNTIWPVYDVMNTSFCSFMPLSIWNHLILILCPMNMQKSNTSEHFQKIRSQNPLKNCFLFKNVFMIRYQWKHYSLIIITWCDAGSFQLNPITEITVRRVHSNSQKHWLRNLNVKRSVVVIISFVFIFLNSRLDHLFISTPGLIG